MNTALWVMQGLLAAFFLMTGFGKITSSEEKHIESGHIKPGDAVWPLRVLGVFELLGCAGIIVPWLTGICPVLTPVAAACFAWVMVAAIVIHTTRREYKMLLLPLVLLMLSAAVAYYRFMVCVQQATAAN